MEEKKDYYEILGVERTATRAEVRAAYKRLAQKHHPDKNPDDAEALERFKLIAEAWEVLSDEGLRKEFDEKGEVSRGGQTQRMVAMQQIGSLFAQIISDPFRDILLTNPIDAARKKIRETKNSVRAELEKVKKNKARMEKMIGRVKHSGGDPDLFNSVLLELMRASDEKAAELSDGIELGELMLELLEDYEVIGEAALTAPEARGGASMDGLFWTPDGA